MNMTTSVKTGLGAAIALLTLLTFTASPSQADTPNNTATPTTASNSTNEANLTQEQTSQTTAQTNHNHTSQQPAQTGCGCCKNMGNNMPGMMNNMPGMNHQGH